VTEVEALGIPRGIENALLAKLEGAIRSIEQGHFGAAIHKLEAFINQVEAKRGSVLTDAEADALVSAAQALIDGLL
jgi:hypothetical protein